MPGFTVDPIHMFADVPEPNKSVHNYTWDIELLVDQPVNKDMVYVQTCGTPNFDIASEEYSTGHAVYQFAKEVRWSDITITFYDVDGLYKELNRLSRKSFMGGGDGPSVQPAVAYMGDTIINVYYHDDEFAYRWVLTNSWIKSVTHSELTYTNSDIKNVSAVLAYTYAFADYSSANRGFPVLR